MRRVDLVLYCDAPEARGTTRGPRRLGRVHLMGWGTGHLVEITWRSR